ncbi:hypothetical protein ATANTOWER_020620 [Ataeniobius toweri]|uniref:Secreted protein n=1 Tax=Ataeniobius toweri TaxID=208326 RepID=A0ABU7BHR7_9TELE|nr:hypothetical protein [Ataeniobius toweri]
MFLFSSLYIILVSKSISGQHRDTQDKQPCIPTLIPEGNLERHSVMFLDHRSKPEYLERTRGCIGRTYKLHAESLTTGWDLKPGPSYCKATVQLAAPVCIPL